MKSTFLLKIVALSVLVWPALGSANPNCGEQLPYGLGPTFDNAGYTVKTTTLCFDDFTVVYSGLTRTPLWSAEKLTPQRLQQAKGLERNNVFHAESGLPTDWQATLEDYVHSGMDRGHLAPSADMPNAKSQAESFSLANIFPQASNLNRGPWERLESSVRKQVWQGKTLFVITGLRFEGETIGFLKGRVGIPPRIYKLVFDPETNAASVFIAENTPDANVQKQSVEAFEKAAGIRFRLGPVSNLDLP